MNADAIDRDSAELSAPRRRNGRKTNACNTCARRVSRDGPLGLFRRLDSAGAQGGVVASPDDLDKIALHCARLPVLDARSPEEILDYDSDGLPR